MIRIAGILAAIALTLLATLLPFLPGPHDPLALPISMMARVFGMASLVLVPIGALWCAASYRQGLLARRRAIAIAAWWAAALVWITVSLAGFALSGLSLALPLVVFPLQRMMLAPAVEFSRDRAILNSGAMIAAIEQFRAVRGHYPQSLLSAHRDYSPGIIGIDRYHYEPSGEAYNLVFEQPATALGTQEFVVYNPRDQQTATGHLRDILEYTPEHLVRPRGARIRPWR